MVTAGLAFQTLVLGVLGVWLLALVPAAIVTMLKGRWPLFFTGFLTLGLTWIVGAVSLAPPDSWWAQRFYRGDRLARASDPVRHPRPLGTVALALSGTLIAILIVGLFAARPSPVLGVDGGSVGHSIGSGDPLTNRSCSGGRGGVWTCEKYDNGGSSLVAYRVTVRGSGCWHAVRVGPAGEGSRKRLSGCITIVDHILG